MIPTNTHHLNNLFSEAASKNQHCVFIYLPATSRVDFEEQCHG